MNQKKNLLIVLLSMTAFQIAYPQKTIKDYESACVLDVVEEINIFFSSKEFNSFSEGMSFVSYKWKWGAINSTGKQIIPFKYEAHGDFSEGMAAVQLNKKWGYVNKQGKLAIPTKYEFADKFKDGLACVQLNGKFGAINKLGVLVIPTKFDYSFSFSEGMALVQVNGKYGFINKQGNIVIPCKYSAAKDFSEGLAAVERDSVYGYINKEGKIILPFKYSYAGKFINGLAKATLKNKRNDVIDELSVIATIASGKSVSYNGLIDKSGKQIDYGNIGDFSEGLYSIKESEKNGKFGFKDKYGTLIIPYKYDEVKSFSGGLARVKKGDKYGYINKQGNIVVPFVYEDGGDFHDGAAWVRRGSKYGFVNNVGNEITPFVFGDLSSFHEGFACVELNGKFGFLDTNGNPLDLDLDQITTKEIALGLVNKYDDEKDKDRKNAINYSMQKWLRKGASKGINDCCQLLGYLYYLGQHGFEKNYAEAVKWLEKTLPGKELGGKNYQYLGYCYSEGGNGIIKDEKRAFQYFLEGAKYENESCSYALAISYYNGDGCEKNRSTALKYAEKLYNINKNNYAIIYMSCLNGVAVDYNLKGNYNLALQYLDKAIQVKPTEALLYSNKAENYIKLNNYKEAVKMWKKALELKPDILQEYPSIEMEVVEPLKAKGMI